MKKTFVILTTLLASFTLFSCNTVKEIPMDKTPAQIFQYGQKASAAGSYSSAEFCFKTVLERFGTDPAVFVEAKYELGHVYSKQKKYDQAEECFNQVLNVYEADPYSLDPAFKKLCQIGLDKINEAKAPKTKKK